MNPQFNKTYFEKYSQGKGYLTQENNPKYEKRLKEIKALGKSKGKLLDIGCGFGFFLDKAKKIGFETHGIDVSNYALEKAKKHHKLAFVDVNKKKLPFKNNFFDVVTLDNTLEHLYNPLFVLIEVKRVLKQNGLLFIEVPLKNRWATDKTHVSYFNKISLKFVLENLNFKILKIGEEGGKLRNIFGLIRLFLKGHTLFNFVPEVSGSFLICYAQKE